MKKQIALFFIVLLKTSTACECPPLAPITKELCNNYNVIFLGKVDSVSKNQKSGYNTAYFSVKELYKGNTQQQTKVNFDASTACMMSFLKGEEWIIYSQYIKFDYLTVSLCGHSRKYFSNEANDFYQVTAKKTFEEEKKFLESTLNIHPFNKANELNIQHEQFKPHNTQPDPMSKLWLLLISLISAGIVIFVTRKKTKNDS